MMAVSWGLLAASLGLLLVLVLLFLLSAMVERSGPIRLRYWAEESGGRILRLYGVPAKFEVFRLLLTAAAKLTPVGLFLAIEGLLSPWVLLPWVWALVVTLLAIGGAELISRRLVAGRAEPALRALTRFYRPALWLLWPLILLLSPLMPDSVFDRQEEEEEDDEVSDGEVDAFIDVGTREGILDSDEGEMVRSVVDFGDTRVRSVMTPRIDMVCVPVDATLDEVAEVFVESTHSRLPVYQGTIDQIVGVLHLRDLLRRLRSANGDGAEADEGVQELAKPVSFMPETKPLDAVLKELQERRQQLAVVVDEYGGTAGLVTIEDLLEEIVGDIVDQDEEQPPQLEPLPDGGWRCDGRMRVDELESLFDVDLDDEPYDTLGGLIFTSFGYVPNRGESIEALGLRMTVEEVEDRRIQTVRLEKLAVGDEAAAAPEVEHDG